MRMANDSVVSSKFVRGTFSANCFGLSRRKRIFFRASRNVGDSVEATVLDCCSAGLDGPSPASTSIISLSSSAVEIDLSIRYFVTLLDVICGN